MHKHKITLSNGIVTYMDCYGNHDYKKQLPPFFWLTVGIALTEFVLIIYLLDRALKARGI
jgi:hypothetical protein